MKTIRLIYTLAIDINCEEDGDGQVFADVSKIGTEIEKRLDELGLEFGHDGGMYGDRNTYVGCSTEYEYDEELFDAAAD